MQDDGRKKVGDNVQYKKAETEEEWNRGNSSLQHD